MKSEQCKLQLKPSFIPYPRRIGPHADAIATVLHLWLPELLLPSWNPSCLGLWTLFPARLDLVSSVPFENPYFANSVLTFRIFFDILNPFPSHLSLLCCKILLSCICSVLLHTCSLLSYSAMIFPIYCCAHCIQLLIFSSVSQSPQIWPFSWPCVCYKCFHCIVLYCNGQSSSTR